MKRYVKSSIEISNDIYDVTDYVFKNYYKSGEEVPDFEELKYYDDIDRNEYNQVVKFFNDLNKKFYTGAIETYEEGWHDLYLQLSDRHIFWDLESEEDITEEDLEYLIDYYVKSFEEQTGTKLYLLGRSNRHACVDFTLDNLVNYDNLKYTWEEYENDFIDDVNSGAF